MQLSTAASGDGLGFGLGSPCPWHHPFAHRTLSPRVATGGPTRGGRSGARWPTRTAGRRTTWARVNPMKNQPQNIAPRTETVINKNPDEVFLILILSSILMIVFVCDL